MNVAALSARLCWHDLSQSCLRKQLDWARAEDLNGYGLAKPPEYHGDLTTTHIAHNGSIEAKLIAREKLVLCGIGLIDMIIQSYASSCVFHKVGDDGENFQKNQVIGYLKGPVAEILTMERVILNYLQHLSGIATNTAAYVGELTNSNSRLLDTRKTTPGYRLIEKYAVACGGGWNHRLGLFDRVMLKDNHLALSGHHLQELNKIVGECRKKYPALPVEIEVDEQDQIDPVLEAAPDIILLDNFDMSALREWIPRLKPHVCVEVSGGVTKENLASIAALEPHFISCGAIIHQSRWPDIALEF